MSYFVGGIGNDWIPTFAQLDFMEQELKKGVTDKDKDIMAQSSLEGKKWNTRRDLYGMSSVGIDTYDEITDQTSQFIKSAGPGGEVDPCKYHPPHFDNHLRRQMVKGGGMFAPIREGYINYPNFQSRRAPENPVGTKRRPCKYKDVWYDSPAQLTGETLGLYFP